MDTGASRAAGRGGAATAETVSQQIDRLERIYEFRAPEEVRTYLTENPDLIPLVAEAAAKIPEFLPPDEPLVLEVVWDPEDEDDPGELFALIPTRMKLDEVRPRLHRMIREWLIGARGPVGLRFNVDVRFL